VRWRRQPKEDEKPRNRYTQKKILQFYSRDADGVVLQQRWCVSHKHHDIALKMTIKVKQSYYRSGQALSVPGG
jgi:hypothetical protein